MTREEYGAVYNQGYNTTKRFLVSRGLSYDSAEETAQAAWARGWERVGQLRNPKMVVTWVNSIALNIYRTYLRHEPPLQISCEGLDVTTASKINLSAIDVRHLLETSKEADQLVLTLHYLEGNTVQEIAKAQGWTVMAVRIRMHRARRAARERLAA
jgi:RNA polymerase sigma factor (sigma-70 family)